MQIKEQKSPNFGARRNGIKTPSMIVIHSINLSLEASLNALCNPENEWSAHYLISETGDIYKLIEEKHRAWHAGLSYWRGETDINSHSIGIELQHQHLEGDNAPYPLAQIDSLIKLCKDIFRRWNIPRYNVIGHSDIAPTRKIDPDFPFIWKELAEHKIGIWTDEFSPLEEGDNLETLLQKIGYDTTSLSSATLAFNAHFYPENYGISPNEDTTKRAKAVLELLQSIIS